jgi:hypothetical protein
MARHIGAIVSCLLILAAGVTTAAADPPRPGTTDSGLNESAEATLWSKQPGDSYVSPAEYRAAYGENRTTIHQIANGTDLTFHKPPGTAQQWTRYAHQQYTPGGANASVYPPHAERRNSTFIKDAHATIFAVTPATRTYLEPTDVRLYAAPDGQLLGTVDYRIEPAALDVNVSGTEVGVVSHEITDVRLYANDALITRTAGLHTPAINYSLDPTVETLRLEADIEATVRTTVPTDDEPGSDTPPTDEVSVVTDSVTVTDRIDIEVYDLRAISYRAEYPDGKTGIAVLQSAPWQGYTLNANGTERVRGVWRFFNAREPEWDILNRSTRDGTETQDSDAIPIYVHAYPSEIGPRAKPEYAGPRFLTTWGAQRRSPASEIPANVSVDIVNRSYAPTWGIAVESSHVDRDHITVHGIVHGTQTTPREWTREVRESRLSATIIGQNTSHVSVHLELTDKETGAPIMLQDAARVDPVTGPNQTGHVAIAGKVVKTNATGEAVVTIAGAGTYTARYHPESWLTADPAYAGDSAFISWHPLATVTGWVTLLARGALALLPLGVAWYAGKHLSTLITWKRY